MISVVETLFMALKFLQFYSPGIEEGLRYDEPSRYWPTHLDDPSTTLYNQERKSPISRAANFY